MTVLAALVFGAALRASAASAAEPCAKQTKFVVIAHAGTGGELPPEKERATRAALAAALRIGQARLKAGARAIDAVQAVVESMEDSGHLNAGKGGVQNRAGFVELDASIMDGRDRRAGAVAGIRRVKNPIAAARAVMDKSEHVLLAGSGADAFAKGAGVPSAPPGYFIHETSPSAAEPSAKPHGSVGAVALDRCGDLAAATSTGGWPGKLPGRIGDSPIVGAGTFASDDTCAVSATGHGEWFIRYSVAHDVSAMMEYGGLTVAAAAEKAIKQKIAKTGAHGGVIAVDAKGDMAWPFVSPTMARGFARDGGEIKVGVGAEMTVAR